MPLYVLIQLIPWWLRDQDIGLAAIGFFSLISLPYTWKFAWAPLVDRYWVKMVGRRRTWMLVTQIVLIPCIALLPQLSPASQMWWIATVCSLIAFLSATQDIAIVPIGASYCRTKSLESVIQYTSTHIEFPDLFPVGYR